MKRIIAILIAVMLLATPVMAGYEHEANAENVTATINAYANKPNIDAQVGEFSYTQINYAAGDISYAWDDNLDGSEALAKAHDFQIYATYDASNVYVLISTDTNSYFNDLLDGDGNAWQYSVIQFNFAAADDFGTDRLEFGIWRNSEDGSLGAVIWNQHPFANEFVPEAGSNYTVDLRGGRLYYQVIVPVNTFLAAGSVSEGDVIGMNFVMGQTVAGGGGYIHTQYASGCTGEPGKAADRFAKITLGSAMELPAAAADDDGTGAGGGDPADIPAPAPGGPAPAPAPVTADPITLIVLGSLISAAGAVIVKKRK